MKRLRFYLYALTLAAALAVVGAAIQPPKAEALSGSEFNAANIIDDAVFFNPNTMGPTDIQSFLNSKVPVCDTNGSQPYGGTTRGAYGTSQGYPPPYTCLKDFTENIAGRSPDSYCGGAIGGGVKTSAQIIYEVSVACGVNPKVLIVLLQKEQSLVTDDWPWSIQYRSATGYGCPDTAPCDAEYYGFFNQVYNAARQFQRYVRQPQLFNYRAGITSYVQYNPNAGCGGTNIAIQNGATAALYNYTPYQPNAAALANLYGTGDGCSAYGNRNFWRMFIDWFGSVRTNTPFAWNIVTQEAYSDSARTKPFTNTVTAAPNARIYMRIKAHNIGNQTWQQSFMRVGTAWPNDRTSIFYDSSNWLAPQRPSAMLESSVGPGSIGTFEFVLKAPSTTGSYREYFNLVADGHTWLNDWGLQYPINVVSQTSASNSQNVQLSSGSTLLPGNYLMSPDRQSMLFLQGDGNIVLYSNFKAVWSSNTQGLGGNRLVMQTDGNLVLYNANMQAVWATTTAGNAGAFLILQSDGNLVLYNASISALWATYTIHNPEHLSYVNNSINVPTVIHPNQQIETANRSHRLILQPDGNLVIYSGNTPIWATGTDGKSVSALIFQGDGNLVLYDTSARPVWASYSQQRGSTSLYMQPDGNLVMYNQLMQPTWATNTAGQ